MCYTFAICSWSRETVSRGTGRGDKGNGPPSEAQSAQSETQNVIRYLLALIFSVCQLDVVIVVNTFFGLFRIARIQNERTCQRVRDRERVESGLCDVERQLENDDKNNRFCFFSSFRSFAQVDIHTAFNRQMEGAKSTFSIFLFTSFRHTRRSQTYFPFILRMLANILIPSTILFCQTSFALHGLLFKIEKMCARPFRRIVCIRKKRTERGERENEKS